MDAQTKVSRAIIKLVANYTFYGTCALRLNVRETTDYKTMCTDGRSILWNREFVDECNEEEVMGTIAHEVWHVILGHHFRIGKREHKKWNIATDFSINNSLIEEGFSLPPGALIDDKYINMNGEKIYDLIDDDEYNEEPNVGCVRLITENLW